MATVNRRRTDKGEWRSDVRYRINGRPIERAFKRRQDAEAFRRQVEAAEVRGVVVDPRRSSERLGEYAQAWLASRRRVDGRPLAPRTVELYRDLLDRLILPTFDQARLSPSGPSMSGRGSAPLRQQPALVRRPRRTGCCGRS